jgi:hypothetical protein
MKRWLLISSIILILLLIAVWVYLLFFNTNTKSDLFSGFGFGDTTDTTVIIPQEEVTPIETGIKDRLRQLSLKRVIGYSSINTGASSTPLFYFVEAGTGHVFSLDIQTGTETRISNVTVAQARSASISPDGRHILIGSGKTDDTTVTLLTLATSSVAQPTSYTFPDEILQYTFTDKGEILYTTQNIASVSGILFDVKNNITKTLFTAPFREATIVWGDTALGTHLIFPKPAAHLEGYLYLAREGGLRRTPLSGFGLSAFGTAGYGLVSTYKKDVYSTLLYNYISGTLSDMSLPLIPEKCLMGSDRLFCALPQNLPSGFTLDAWYKGTLHLSDTLWRIDLTEDTPISMVADIKAESGRDLDMTQISTNARTTELYFINKTDQTIWVYENPLVGTVEQQ